MRKILFTLVSLLLLTAVGCTDKEPPQTKSTRKERLLIKEGNNLYKEGKYTAAAQKYQDAIVENPASATAVYDLGLTRIRQSNAPGESEENRQKIADEGQKMLESVAQTGATSPRLAAKAAYNLGNLAFHGEKYDVAIEQYKRSLRLDPDDDDARRNLRIAQKKLKNQDKDQDKQDQDKQEQEQQDQQKDQDKQDKQDQQQDQQQEQQKPQSRMSEQTAAQILQAVEQKENATRARVGGIGDKSRESVKSKNW